MFLFIHDMANFLKYCGFILLNNVQPLQNTNNCTVYTHIKSVLLHYIFLFINRLISGYFVAIISGD